MTPVDIAHHRAEGRVVVTWADDTVSVYPVSYLRAWCPCAECQGHSGITRYRPVEAIDGARLEMWEVGAYALGLRFSDGHDKGIFRWDYLRALAPEQPPAGLKRGRFVAGEYTPD